MTKRQDVITKSIAGIAFLEYKIKLKRKYRIKSKFAEMINAFWQGKLILYRATASELPPVRMRITRKSTKL